MDASDDEEAVNKIVRAMDEHVAAAPHPQVPSDLTEAQKIGMVTEQMKKG